MSSDIGDSFARILDDACSPTLVRAIEGGQDHSAFWSLIEDTGFIDALVPENVGGAGLTLAEAAPLIAMAGRYAVPVPLGETIILRALLASSNVKVPRGAVTFSGPVTHDGVSFTCNHVPGGQTADWVILPWEEQCRLLPLSDAKPLPAASPLEAGLRWTSMSFDKAEPVHCNSELLSLQALVHALQITGATAAVFDRTRDYANDRQQFGRPIGKFQAIQHQLAVMAEHVLAARMATESATSCDGLRPAALRVAIAKARTSEAAVEIAALSHSIHGAIGFTEEYDLQLFTRRLQHWRQAAGAESYWHSRIGVELLNSNDLCLDLLRRATDLETT